jgi:hypothetical protein
MKNQIKILIPFICYCCSKGAIEKSDKAFEKFNKINKKTIINIDFVKNLFVENQSELLDPQKFWLTISSIFQEIEKSFDTEDSKLVINSIKRIISISAVEFNLPEIECEYSPQFLIADYDIWFDFLEILNNNIDFMNGIVLVKYSKSKHIAYCPAKIENKTILPITEVMISQIKDYWMNQDLNQ